MSPDPAPRSAAPEPPPPARRRFLRAFLDGPGAVGAVLPTSARTVRDTLDMAPVQRAARVVELGAGTGVYTREILARLRPDGELLAFELDANLAAGLSREFPDPRLRVLDRSATELEAVLGADGPRPEVIVSALPFTSLPAGVRVEVLDVVRRALAPGGTFLVLQYSPFVQGALRSRWPHVRRRLSPLNVPPAVLFACRDTP